MKRTHLFSVLPALASLAVAHAFAAEPAPKSVGTVFYILLENRNFTAGGDTSGGEDLLGHPAAPYINALVTPGSPESAQVSYCTAYHHVLAQPLGASKRGGATSVHPSEPNYIWFEGGSNFGVLNDNDPYGSNKQARFIADYIAANPSLTGQHLRGLLQNAGISWYSYQEDANLAKDANGKLTNRMLPEAEWTVPLSSFSGHSPSYKNPYNGKNRWSYGVKHEGALFFPDTNGCPDADRADRTPANPMARRYRPLQQFEHDLRANKVARFNVITPELYNDMHNAFADGFDYRGKHYAGDACRIALGDNFLSKIVPMIMASDAYRNNGVIVIWTDETEGTNQNDFRHTIPEIVISPLAKGNAYASHLNYTHSSDLNTLQKIFQVAADTPTGFINDAANPSYGSGKFAGTAPGFGTGPAYDLADLFVPGVIPTTIPKPVKQGTVAIFPSAFASGPKAGTVTQTVRLVNNTGKSFATPVYLAVDSLSANTSLVGAVGKTQKYAPLKSAYVVVSPDGLPAGATKEITLEFAAPSPDSGDIMHSLRVIATAGKP